MNNILMKKITVTITVDIPKEIAWEYWNDSKHIPHWSFATPEWGAESIENNLQEKGHFKHRMFAKDGSASFDFEGVYTLIEPHQRIEYTITDGRNVSVLFEDVNGSTRITESFDPEHENSEEMQRAGWQAFLENFKKYAEESKR